MPGNVVRSSISLSLCLLFSLGAVAQETGREALRAEVAGGAAVELQAELDSKKIAFIDTAELLAYLAGRGAFTLLDARSAEEYQVGHVYAAVNVPHDAVDPHLAMLPEDLDAPIVTYCKTGMRAARLAERLRELGYRDVRVLGPRQMFWSDTAPMFNCGVSAPAEPALLPASG